jgi:thiamine transport system substrate-binding protein
VIQDPRSSTPGLGLLLWVKAAYGDKAGRSGGLADNIVTVTPGWSEAYGLFLEGEADMVLSYTTSPAYHLIAESDDTKAGRCSTKATTCRSRWRETGGSDQPDLARAFLAFTQGPEFQAVIPTTNWMYPAAGAVARRLGGAALYPGAGGAVGGLSARWRCRWRARWRGGAFPGAGC